MSVQEQNKSEASEQVRNASMHLISNLPWTCEVCRTNSALLSNSELWYVASTFSSKYKMNAVGCVVSTRTREHLDVANWHSLPTVTSR